METQYYCPTIYKTFYYIEKNIWKILLKFGGYSIWIFATIKHVMFILLYKPARQFRVLALSILYNIPYGGTTCLNEKKHTHTQKYSLQSGTPFRHHTFQSTINTF